MAWASHTRTGAQAMMRVPALPTLRLCFPTPWARCVRQATPPATLPSPLLRQ